MLQGPATTMVRPHPAVWRFIHGVLICYIVFLVFMLFQDVSDARQFLRVSTTTKRMLCWRRGNIVWRLKKEFSFDGVAAASKSSCLSCASC